MLCEVEIGVDAVAAEDIPQYRLRGKTWIPIDKIAEVDGPVSCTPLNNDNDRYYNDSDYVLIIW
jgi:hypothetical protein